MFRSIMTKSLRDYRWAVLGWGIGLAILVYAQYATYASSLTGGNSGAQLQQLGEQFKFFGEPVRLDTPGGFVTFKLMGIVPLLVGTWAVLAGARMIRGDEERGALDILLSTPQPRAKVLLQKVLGLAVATGLIAVLIALGIVGGMASAKVPIDLGAALLASISACMVAFLFGALALLLAQVMSRSGAAGLAGALMALLWVVDATGRTVSSASNIRPISPFYYYQQNFPLVPGYATNWGALVVIAALCVVVTAASVPLFLQRDAGRSALADVTFGQRSVSSGEVKRAEQSISRAAKDVWLRSIGLQAMRRQLVAMCWWIAAIAVIAGYMVAIARTTEKQFQDLLGSSPFFQKLFSGTDLGTNSGFISVLVFGYIPPIVTVFAGILAYRWATDLDKGRMELVLSTPQSRWRLVLERFAAVTVAAVGVTVCTWIAVMIAAQSNGLAIDGGRVAAASVGLLPLELITAGLVFALAGLLPPGAVIGIMSAYLGIAFMADLLKTLLQLPTWALDLSMFHQYGTPMLTGMNWGAFIWMLLVAAALVGLGGWQFVHRDVDRGAVDG